MYARRHHILSVTIPLTVAVVLLLAASPASAAPANDNFANAQTVGPALPISVSGSDVDATAEAGEPDSGGSGFGARYTVWYKWTPASTVQARIDLCTPNGPLGFSVYTGSAVNALTLIASSNGSCRFNVTLSGGTNYKIGVDSAFSPGVDFTLNIRESLAAANDNFANAQVVGPALPVDLNTNNVDATSETFEPSHYSGLDPSHSLWWTWTPASSVTAVISTCVEPGSGPGIAVYTGSALESLTHIADSAGDCRVEFNATAGVTYKIAADWVVPGGHEEGSFPLNIRVRSLPPNDAFANSQLIGPALPVSTAGTNLDGTAESGEPDHFGHGAGASGSVWYRWTPSSSVAARIETCDPNEPRPGIAVYTGSTLNALTPIANSGLSDPFFGDLERCVLNFDAVGGVTYRIAIAGPTRSAFTLQVIARPPNDDFAHAQTVGPALPAALSGTTVNATPEADEPEFPAYGTVWYRWTAGASGAVAANTCTRDFRGYLRVYTGATLAGLSPQGADTECDTGGNIDTGGMTFQAVAGTTYWMAIDGTEDTQRGSFTLKLRLAPSVPVVTGTLPLSPAASNDPAVAGIADPGSTVKLYTSSFCNGYPVAQGSAEAFGGSGIPVHVADNTTTSFYARSIDPDQNRTACSTTFSSYSQSSTPAQPPSSTPTQPVAQAPSRAPAGKPAAKKCKKKKSKKAAAAKCKKG